jgi:hypothetical protein
MKMKPKTFRRLVLLGVLLTLVVGGFAAAVVIRKHRMNARITESREAGFKAVAAKDHAQTLERLGSYLRRRPEDAEALLAYARARRAVEDRAGRHLVEAAAVYQRYLALNPADDQARAELFDTLVSAALDVEILDLAARLRPTDLTQITPQHARVVREEIAARLRRKDARPATVDLAKRLTEIAPADYSSHALYVATLLAAERRQDAVDYVNATAAAAPDDPRVALLQAAVGDDRLKQPGWLLTRLAAIAGLDPQTGARLGPPVDASPNILTAVMSGFDTLGRADLALAALEPAARSGDRDALRAWIRRAWYAGADDAVISAGPRADAADGAPQSDRSADAWSDPDVLAFKALSLQRTGDASGAQAALARITGIDFRSRAWAAAAPALASASTDSASTDAAAATTALRTAIDLNPVEPVFRLSLARTLLARAQPELARQEVTTALDSPYSAGWSLPDILLADTFLAENRPSEAEQAALRGLARHPRDQRLNFLGLVSKIDQVDRGIAGRESAQDLLKRLDALAAEWSAKPESAPSGQARQWFILGRAVCADAVGDRDRLALAIKDASKSSAQLTPAVLARLAAISARNNLDVDFGPAMNSAAASPESILARAIVMRSQGKADEARALLDNALADPAHTGRQWQEIRPRALEAASDPAAAAAWKQFAETFSTDLDAQLSALEASSVARDPALVDQLVQRFAAAAGPTGKLPLRVRIAQSRSLLLQPPSTTTRDRAIGILRPITSEAPELAEPRLLLAQALLMELPGATPDRAGAIEQLRAAIPVSARAWEIRFRLGELMATSGDNQAAAREFAAVASDTRADPDARWDAVARLASLGQFDAAASGASSLVDAAAKLTPKQAVSAARILTTAGNPEHASQALAKLADTPLSPDDVTDLALAWAALAAPDKAKALIDRAAAGASPADKPAYQRATIRVLARSAPEQALRAAEQLVADAPGDPENFRVLAALYTAEGRAADAQRTVDAGLARHPDDPDLRLQRVQIGLSAGADDAGSLEALARALDTKPEFKRRAEAVRALVALRNSSAANDPAALKALVTQFPDEPTVASFVSGALLKQRRAAEAADVAAAGLRRFPTFTQLASDAYAASAAAGRWQDALIAAEQWQRLARARAADVAVARANLALGRPRLARAVLEPHLAGATADPQRSISVIGPWTEVLLAQGSPQDARKFLEPLAAKSPDVLRSVWIPLASTRVPVADAPAWLSGAEPLATDDPARLLLARAWFALADRDQAGRAAHLDKARTLALDVHQRGATPQTSYLLGMIAGAQGKFDDADANFTAAAQDPALKVPATVGLARLAMARARPADAVTLAQTAVAAATPPDPEARLVLAESLQALAAASDSTSRAARFIDAAKAYESAAAGSGPQLLAQAALCYEQGGQPVEAIRLYDLALQSPAIDPAAVAIIQNNLAYLLVTARTDPDSIARGLELARSATSAQPNGSSFDTLGSCELAAGNAAAAIEAFRRSLTLRAQWPSTMVKLADALITAAPADTSEAASLLDQAQALLASKPNAAVSERLATVRTKLKSTR